MKIVELPNGKYAVRLGWPFRSLYVDLGRPRWEWSGTSEWFEGSCCGTKLECEMAILRRGRFQLPFSV